MSISATADPEASALTRAGKQTVAVIAAALLAGCNINYSAMKIGDATDTASIATIATATGTLLVVDVNGVKPPSQPAMGREMLVPAGSANISVAWFQANITLKDRKTINAELAPNGNYLISASPDYQKMVIHFDIHQVSRHDFIVALCDTQRRVQENLKSINPQAAPACADVK